MDTSRVSGERIIAAGRRFGGRTPRGLAVALSFASGLMHAWVVRDHAAHWWVYGVFFVGLAVAQAAYALLLWRTAVPARGLLASGILGNLAIMGVYLWSRAVAVPFGPHAGRPEPVGALDLASLLAEGAVVGILAAMLVRAPRAGSVDGSRRPLLRPIAVTLVLLSWTAAAGPAAGHRPATRFVTTLTSSATPATPEPTVAPTEEPVTEILPPEEEAFPSPEAEWKPCTPRPASKPGVPGEVAAGTARAITYGHQGDIWLYGVATRENHRLTGAGFECMEANPSFRTPGVISFVADGVLHDFDLRSGDIDEVARTTYGINWYGWSPDGGTLAYLGSTTDGTRSLLVIRDTKTGAERTIRTLVTAEGRCGSQDDEAAITWSPDGSSILVVVTHLEEGSNTMYVVTPSGDDVVPPQKGTHARWSPDGKTVYYREFSGKRRWFAFDVTSGTKRGLAMTPGTYRLSVSPDGRALAYDGDSDGVASYVYDLATAQERRLAAGRAAPVWLSAETIVVSNTTKCEDCMDMTWQAAGSTSRVEVASGTRQSFPMTSTMEAEVLAGPAPEPAPDPSPSETPMPEPSPSPSEVPSPEPSASPSIG